ncbi:hypothetical protein JO972_05015 [Verrucomicrobiaceae bacterium 5K15]|uniref:Uncharacterized protein n=1 Tax=Oceaniferula flava TaxID=2800421 RepID=A0AAE2SCB4_9BACT|nr:hypothetical protein [Oceaniferula flavus]MBK1854304.1 hypothetical protein [Oceaniferula flavus]MBM1135610.1 hypothetical protein [Oceaniferula flavus]
MAEEKKDAKAETAWQEYDLDNTNGFYFGIIELAPDFVSQLLPSPKEATADDPFGGENDKDTIRVRPGQGVLGPIVDMARLPQCVPQHPGYRDISKLVHELGIRVSEHQWVLHSGGMSGDNRLYYCLDPGNADILESICFAVHHCCGPFNFIHRSVLVSVPDQGLDNQAWTMERLLQLDYTVHARHGNVCRSGERALIEFRKKAPEPTSYLVLEPTLGESAIIADVRIEYAQAWTGEHKSSVMQNTAFTTSVGKPLILDCGIQGQDRRNFLLITETSELKGLLNHSEHRINRIHISKIEGAYAMRGNMTPKGHKATPKPFETKAFRCDSDFLVKLRTALNHNDLGQDSPFGAGPNTKGPQKIPAPIRIKNYKPTQHLGPDDTVFDITPQCHLLGLTKRQGESIYFNSSNSRLIITGSLTTQADMVSIIKGFSSTARMVRITARIVEVNAGGLKPTQWSLEKIALSHPQTQAMYASTARSGERATSGQEMAANVYKNKEGKEVTSRDYEFEVEPTISESSQKVDLGFAIHSQALGDEKTSIILETAITIPDGKPTIVELGHPNSASRTHLLILHADVITPDGSYYRDRFKALK